jgi:hypothetical protein
MEPRRKRRLFCQISIFLLLILASPLVYYFDVYFIVAGYLRNEPCYRLRPATYWRAQIQSKYRWIRDKHELTTNLAIQALSAIGRSPTDGYPLRVGDENALPVLLFLVKDSDENVRKDAISLLGVMDTSDERTIGPIIEGLDDQSVGVREASFCALDGLSAWDPLDARLGAAVPRLIRWANEDRWDSGPRYILDRIRPQLRASTRLPNGEFTELRVPKS